MGIRFKPIDGLTLAHLGLFWASVKDDFGKSEEASPLMDSLDEASLRSGVLYPRLWLIQNDDQYLIQLQPNIFFFNWRRQQDDQNYPSFSTITPLFHKYLGLYIKFLADLDLPPPEAVSCDLTYVNMIPDEKDGEPNYGFSNLFPDLVWRNNEDRFLPVPKALSWQTTFDFLEDVGELTAKIQSAKRKSDGQPLLRFELTARNRDSRLPLDEIDGWFEIAHRMIVMSFADLTSSEAQTQVWKRVGDAS